MNQKIKKLCQVLLAIIFAIYSKEAFANAAQPGVWSAGGSGVFSLLYPEDSNAYKKIQMQSEQVYMKLYPGFAVVKGVYHFYNDQDSTISLKIGYPVNQVFESKRKEMHRNEVVYEDIYSIKASWGGKDSLPIMDTLSNWYVWDASFKPRESTTFQVYFIVSTNNASQSQGYNKTHQNAFIYLIETGSIWKSPIDSGDFYVFVDTKIAKDQIRTNKSGHIKHLLEENIFHLRMTDYGYTPDENLVFTYHEHIENFQLDEILNNKDMYFKEIDSLSKSKINKNAMHLFESKSPYEVDGTGSFVSWIFYFTIYGIPSLIGLFALFLLYKVYSIIRNKKEN